MNATGRRPSFACNLVLGCLAAAPGLAGQTPEKSGLAARERAAGFEFALPKGWKRQDDAAQGVSALTPGGVEPGTCGVVILASAAGTGAGHHQRMWTGLTANATPVGEPARSEPGHFRSSRARTRTEGGEAWLILYTAERSGSVATLYFVASTREQYEKHGAETDALVAGITFPAPVRAVVARSPASPTPVPERDVAMTGLWIRGDTSFRYGMDPGGTLSTRLRSQIEMLALWENGIAWRGMHDSQVMAAKGLMSVREGLVVVDAAALAQSKSDDDRYSRWTEREGVVDLPVNRFGALQLTRKGHDFTAQDGSQWVRLAPVDGARLQGTFARAQTASAPEMSLTFGKDGSFAAANVIHTLGGPHNNPDFPMQGKGTYEFRKWSLILRFEGGFTQTIQFLGNGEGLGDAKALVLAGAEFVRR